MSCKRCLLALQEGAAALAIVLRDCPEQLPAGPWKSHEVEIAQLAAALLAKRETEVDKIFAQRRAQR